MKKDKEVYPLWICLFFVILFVRCKGFEKERKKYNAEF